MTEANHPREDTGKRFAFHLLNPGSSPASAPTPSGAVTYSRCVTALNCRSRNKCGTLSPWENAAGIPSEDGPFRHSFKMPITTTKLSRNKTSRRRSAPSARDPDPGGTHRWERHGQRFDPESRTGPQPMTNEPRRALAEGQVTVAEQATTATERSLHREPT